MAHGRVSMRKTRDLQGKLRAGFPRRPDEPQRTARTWVAERVLTVDPGRLGDLAQDLPGNGDRFSHLSSSACIVRATPLVRTVTAYAEERRLPPSVTQSAESLLCAERSNT